MKSILATLYAFEDENDFESAFLGYKKTFDPDCPDFELWRSFYFFLWYCLVEDSFLKCEEFNIKYNLRKEYNTILNYGHRTYSNNPEFNFIVGYTISVYPYIFPNILETEALGNQLIKKAWSLDRSNLIYNMARLADSLPGSKEYSLSCINASTLVLVQYKGNGYLNSYFRSVLCRI
jgi:hypothetical protein